MDSLKVVDIQKGASKIETLANPAEKEMINLLEDKKIDKSKHENFRQSFEEVHKHLLTYEDMFNEFIETGKTHSMLWNEYIIDVEITFDFIYVEKAPCIFQHLLKCCVMRLYKTIKIILPGVQYTLRRCFCYQKLHQR